MDEKETDDYQRKLLELRMLLNAVDKNLINLLISRFSITDEIGRLKQVSNKPIYDSKRESSVIHDLTELIRENRDNVESDLLVPCIIEIYLEIMKQSKLSQSNVTL